MNIKLNGKPHELPAAMTIAALTEHLGLNIKQVAIERNLAIVPRARWGEVMIAEGDAIEVVGFIGGG